MMITMMIMEVTRNRKQKLCAERRKESHFKRFTHEYVLSCCNVGFPRKIGKGFEFGKEPRVAHRLNTQNGTHDASSQFTLNSTFHFLQETLLDRRDLKKKMNKSETYTELIRTKLFIFLQKNYSV